MDNLVFEWDYSSAADQPDVSVINRQRQVPALRPDATVARTHPNAGWTSAVIVDASLIATSCDVSASAGFSKRGRHMRWRASGIEGAPTGRQLIGSPIVVSLSARRMLRRR